MFSRFESTDHLDANYQTHNHQGRQSGRFFCRPSRHVLLSIVSISFAAPLVTHSHQWRRFWKMLALSSLPSPIIKSSFLKSGANSLRKSVSPYHHASATWHKPPNHSRIAPLTLRRDSHSSRVVLPNMIPPRQDHSRPRLRGPYIANGPACGRSRFFLWAASPTSSTCQGS